MSPLLNLPNLKCIPLVLKLPQVGYANINVEILENRLRLDSKYHNNWLDFVVTIDGELNVGKGHYRLAKKATSIFMAGELMVDMEGLIIKINNNSGHYQPSSSSFLKFIECLAEYYSILDSQITMEIIQW